MTYHIMTAAGAIALVTGTALAQIAAPPPGVGGKIDQNAPAIVMARIDRLEKQVGDLKSDVRSLCDTVHDQKTLLYNMARTPTGKGYQVTLTASDAEGVVQRPVQVGGGERCL